LAAGWRAAWIPGTACKSGRAGLQTFAPVQNPTVSVVQDQEMLGLHARIQDGGDHDAIGSVPLVVQAIRRRCLVSATPRRKMEYDAGIAAGANNI